MNLKFSRDISLDTNKTYKVFLVEVDDDNRERVVSGLVRRVVIEEVPHYDNVLVDSASHPVSVFQTGADVTWTLEMMPFEDGVWARIEDFSNQEEDEE